MPDIRSFDESVLRSLGKPLKVRSTEAARIERPRISLQHAAVPRVGALRAGKFEREQPFGCWLIELCGASSHKGMVAHRKYHQQVSKVAATGVTQPSQVFDVRQWIVGVIAHGHSAGRHCRTDEGTRGLRLHDAFRCAPVSSTSVEKLDVDFTGAL